ncbi:MAG: GDP-D-mannose 3',5'-epimerase [Bacteroidia bacterium]|jgi:GDP-D-mannose 3',5'-epimerase
MRVVVLGAGGFIGSHLVVRLKERGDFVVGVDIKHPEFEPTKADQFIQGDLRDPMFCEKVFEERFDQVYQLAADMGGAGYIFTGDHDYSIMHDSALINLNVCNQAIKSKTGRLFFSSSACVYPKFNQTDPSNPNCAESTAIPAEPDSEYGWEKLFSERLYLNAQRNHQLSVCIARFHNIYGPNGPFTGGREKAVSALCRKVSEQNAGEIEVWGDGSQTRSFLYIDDCIEGIMTLMASHESGPFNIGSEEIISIQNLAKMVILISRKELGIKNIEGPIGVMGRNSSNDLVTDRIGWKSKTSLEDGVKFTYGWISSQ